MGFYVVEVRWGMLSSQQTLSKTVSELRKRRHRCFYARARQRDGIRNSSSGLSATFQSLAVIRRFSSSSNLQTCLKPSRLSQSSRLRRVRISAPVAAAITKPTDGKRINVRASIQSPQLHERPIHIPTTELFRLCNIEHDRD